MGIAGKDDYKGLYWKCPECSMNFWGLEGASSTCDSCQCALVSDKYRLERENPIPECDVHRGDKDINCCLYRKAWEIE